MACINKIKSYFVLDKCTYLVHNRRVKLNKREVISRLVEIPTKNKRPFWAKEMKLLNGLMGEYDNPRFWSKVKFSIIFPSLAYLKTDFGKGELRRKYNEFNFDIPIPQEYYLSEKVGEDKKYAKKIKTIKDFLS
jgi:hypothetical protein